MDHIDIGNRHFYFKVPTAWDGCKIFNCMTSYDLPFGISIIIGMRAGKTAMPPNELESFMKLCLKNCFEKLEGQDAPVVDQDGGIGITEGSAQILTKLTVQFIRFFMDCWWGESNSTSSPEQLTTSPSTR